MKTADLRIGTIYAHHTSSLIPASPVILVDGEVWQEPAKYSANKEFKRVGGTRPRKASGGYSGEVGFLVIGAHSRDSMYDLRALNASVTAASVTNGYVAELRKSLGRNLYMRLVNNRHLVADWDTYLGIEQEETEQRARQHAERKAELIRENQRFSRSTDILFPGVSGAVCKVDGEVRMTLSTYNRIADRVQTLTQNQR